MWSRRSTVNRMIGSDVRGFTRRAYIALRQPRQLILVAAMLAALPAAAQPYPVVNQPDLAYGPLPAEQSDLYLPTTGLGKRPAVVVIHGGGWVSGSRHWADYFANTLAANGIVVLNIDYRLADKTMPDTRWPAQLVDAQLAVRFPARPCRRLRHRYSAHRRGRRFLRRAIGGVSGHAVQETVPGDEAGLYSRERPNVKAVVESVRPDGSAGDGPVRPRVDRGDVRHHDADAGPVTKACPRSRPSPGRPRPSTSSMGRATASCRSTILNS